VTDPYKNEPSYGAPGTGPDANWGGQQQPQGQQPYGQPQYGAPQPQYGEAPGYNQGSPYGQPPQQPYGQPGAPAPYYGGAPDADAPYGRNPQTGEPYSDKQKLTAGLLEIFLGGFGAGRFYLNQPGIAIAQIAVTWLTCGIGGIWPLIDGIMMLTGSVKDEYGRPLRD
jgi:TM2 domain-containing membrane protein YozV